MCSIGRYSARLTFRPCCWSTSSLADGRRRADRRGSSHPAGAPSRQVGVNWVAARVAGRRIPDLNSGLRAFRRDCARQYPDDPVEPLFLHEHHHACVPRGRLPGVYHPINYHPRIGKSKITPWHFMDFLMLVLRMAVLFQPLRVFLPLALLFGGLGVLKTVYDIFALFPRTSASVWAIFYLPVALGDRRPPAVHRVSAARRRPGRRRGAPADRAETTR